MKPYKILSEKLARLDKKLITSSEIKKDCEKLSVNYDSIIKYLLRNKYLERIFRGIFYVYSIEERKLGKSEMNFYEIISEALRIKGVKNWYFGLETALKFNNMTHEYFTVIYIINDVIFRAKPIKIKGHKVKFHKTLKKMFEFGINKKPYPHSNPEKTSLDLYYFKHHDINNFREITEKLSKTKLKKYSRYYNKKVIKTVNEIK